MIINIDTTQELSPLDLRVLSALAGAEPTEKTVSQPKAAKAAEPKATAEKAAPAPEEPAADDAADDGATLEDAVAIATNLVSNGEAAKVKAALSELGAKRVSELSGSKIAEFVAALS